MTYKDLEVFLTSNNMSAIEFSRKTGISPQILTNAKKRGGHFSGQTMAKIHDAITYKDSDTLENPFSLKQTFELQQILSVPISESSFDITKDEMELIEKFRKADSSTKDVIVRLLAFASTQKGD